MDCVTGAAAATKDQPVISRITIRNTDIFDMETNVSLQKFPYTAINGLHIKTQEHVIRQELLFKVGDKYDPFLISETERNLRALSFIRAARIAKFPQRDGTVVIVVHVNDSWTTEPQLNLGGQNKISSTEVGFKEKNLFGLGKTVGVFYERGDNFTQRQYTYIDPRLLGSRWQLNGDVRLKTEDEERLIKIERPFYSADTRFSARASYDWNRIVLDEFVDNKSVSRFQQTKETSEVFAGTKLGGGRDVVTHGGLRYKRVLRDYERNSQTAAGRDIPTDETTQTVFMDFETSRSNFIEATHLEKMTRVEDINLGPSLRLSPGYSPQRLNGASDSSEGEVAFEKRLFITQKNLFFQKYSYMGRNPFENGENQRYTIQLKNYYLPNDFHTFVVNTRADWGDNLDPDNQVKLGGENGLRAFRTDGIVGAKGWLLDLEDRMFFIDELWSLVSIGGAVFYDTGYVWAQGNPIALSQLRSEVGVGLRFGLTRSSNEVILRLDFSYRLQRDNPGDSPFVVSFGTGQAF